MRNKYQKLINSKNSDLWNDMLQKFKIVLEKSPEKNYITSYEEDMIRIKIDEENINPAYFTHELLHIYLKSKNIFIAKDLSNIIEDNNKLFFVFSDSLKSLLGNCLEHVKMLPLFLDFGFENKLFVGDFAQKLLKDDKFSEIKKSYSTKGILNHQAVDVLIGKFFSMKASNNPRYNYDKYFNGFSKIDKILYNALNDFWAKWMDFDINKSSDYQKILESFIKDMNFWAGKKTII